MGLNIKLIKTNISHHLKLVSWRINFIKEKIKINIIAWLLGAHEEGLLVVN